MDASLLYVTLAFGLLSFFCSTYTTLRTLLPLLPGHPLNRRHAGSAVGPYAAAAAPTVEKRPRLKSAQRFTAYLGAVDIFAACILVWEVASSVSAESQLGESRIAASRVYLATTARPTLLLVVAVLSYANVVQGKQISLGAADWIVWLPALTIYAVGAGLSSMAHPSGQAVWIGLVSWLSSVTFVVTVCFGRLLLAILRVRRIAQREQSFSRFTDEQEKVVSSGDMPYLPHHKFSNLSTSFLRQIGQSSSSVVLPAAHHVLPFTSDTRSAVTYAPSRASMDDPDELDMRREFRSPTPGSTGGLLDRSAASTPSGLPGSNPQNWGDDSHEVLRMAGDGNEEERSRVSLSSMTSRASTYLAPGGFIGNSAVRQALGNSLVKEAWGDSTPPGTGHSPKAQLSQREAKGAMVRIGGHLCCCLLSYALVSPFVFLRLLRPASPVPLLSAILLVIGVCQPGLVLAWQSAASEGFWFRTPRPPVPTSSSARAFEKLEGLEGVTATRGRAKSRASTVRTWKDSLPGIRPDGEDCTPSQRSRVGRALSMLDAHPRLQVLPDAIVEPTSSSSGFVKAAASTGHARLRSLKLSKATVAAVTDFGAKTRPRAGSAASRRTVAGFEHTRRASAPNPRDELVAISLRRSRKTPTQLQLPSKQIPFGSGGSARSASHSTLGLPKPEGFSTPSPISSPSPYPISSFTRDLTSGTRDFDSSPSLSSFPPSTRAPSARSASPSPLKIDYLSSQVLPQLVPSIKVGKDIQIESKQSSLPRRRSTLSSNYTSDSLPSASSKRLRNHRKLSLPLVKLERGDAPPPASADDSWFAVEQSREEEPEESALAAIRQVVRQGAMQELSRPRQEEAGAGTDQRDHREVQPPHTHGRVGSEGTLLDISFEWEDEGVSEVLEDGGALADAEDAAEEDDDEAGDAVLAAHQLARRAASPSPLSPLSPHDFPSSPQQFRPARPPKSQEGSVGLRGSLIGSSDEEDARTGTIHCASVHPVSRSDSSSAESPEAFRLRPAHVPLASISSLRSTSASSIMAPGFHNMIRSRGADWHSGSDDSAASSADEASRSRRSFSPVVPLQPGHRPLSLLGQRDPNSSFSYASSVSDSEREVSKVEQYRRAANERDGKRRSRSGMPLPPLPNLPEPIEEVDEDAKSRISGTPTPRSKRTRPTSPAERRPPLPLPPMPFSSVPTSTVPLTLVPKTPLKVGSRTRARRHHHDSSASSADDENVRPVATTAKAPRSDYFPSPAPSAVRAMR
ncbi:hypothetical protein JCM11641_000898 [Rhodosporidiobolus odoratus]